MIADVVRPAELGAGDTAAWRAIQQSGDRIDNPFLTPEFSQVVGTVRRRARVAVLRDGPATTYFPFERRAFGVVRPMGAGVSDCEGLIVAGPLDVDGQDLLRACDIRLWRFNHLLGDQATVLAPGCPQALSPLIDLDGGFDAYLADRHIVSRSLVSTAERKARKLAREVGELRFSADDLDHAHVERLLLWKREQYRRTGVKDVLAAPDTARILHRLADARGDDFSGVLSVLHAGDEPVAVHLGLRTRTALAWWLPAYDPAYARYSPGVTLILRIAEWAAGTGVRWIDLGKGEETYKDRLQNAESYVADGILARPYARRSFELQRQIRPYARRLRPGGDRTEIASA